MTSQGRDAVDGRMSEAAYVEAARAALAAREDWVGVTCVTCEAAAEYEPEKGPGTGWVYHTGRWYCPRCSWEVFARHDREHEELFALQTAREGTECTVLDVWVCTTCGEIQPRRGVDAHCAGSATEGLAHVDAPMWATTATIAARRDTERPGDGAEEPIASLHDALGILSLILLRAKTEPHRADRDRVRLLHFFSAVRDAEQEPS